MDYCFRRPKEPWEASDGAVHLLKELSSAAPVAAPDFLPELAEIVALEDFEACRGLQTTVWEQLPAIAQGLGRKVCVCVCVRVLQSLKVLGLKGPILHALRTPCLMQGSGCSIGSVATLTGLHQAGREYCASVQFGSESKMHVQVFKRYMDMFWEPLFRSLRCRNPLCEAAASRCLAALSQFVGPRILEGHLSDEQRGLFAAWRLKATPWACPGRSAAFFWDHCRISDGAQAASRSFYHCNLSFRASTAATFPLCMCTAHPVYSQRVENAICSRSYAAAAAAGGAITSGAQGLRAP